MSYDDLISCVWDQSFSIINKEFSVPCNHLVRYTAMHIKQQDKHIKIYHFNILKTYKSMHQHVIRRKVIIINVLYIKTNKQTKNMKFNSFIFIIWLYIDNYICIYLVYWADPECFPNVERAFLLAWERPFIYFFLYDYCLGNIFINKTCSAKNSYKLSFAL